MFTKIIVFWFSATDMSITIHKKIVLDEHNKPVEVIIDYAEWTKIERILEPGQHGMSQGKLAGTMPGSCISRKSR
jgi:hypothetical protein